MQMPLFHHLWFLWFLWWLVVGYAMLSAFGPRLSSIRLPDWVFLSPARYLWLIPLTMIPQWYMGNFGTTPIIGPDTSTGLLPIPHVFAFYAIFFGFGVIYFGYNDQSDRLGKRWWLELSIGLIIILPLMLALTQGWKGPAGYELLPFARRITIVVLQATYPWFITFGLILALPRPFATDHRGPIHCARLAVPGDCEISTHRRGRDGVLVVDLSGDGPLQMAGAISEWTPYPAQ